MGGRCSFDGQRLVLKIGDFHRCVYEPLHTYRVILFAGKKRVFSKEIPCFADSYFAFNIKADVPFYRAEIWDMTLKSRIALGNPIWNEK
jgi:hypothetical protein